MFCEKCGAQNPDDAKICGECGAPLSADAPAAAEGSVAEKLSKMGVDVKNRKTLIGLGAIAVAVVLVVIIAVVAIFGGKPAYLKTVDKMVNSALKADAKGIVSVLPPDVVKEMEDMYDDRDEMLEMMEDGLETSKDYMEDELGKNLKAKYEVRRDKELINKEIKELEEKYEDRYDVDLDIKEARRLKLRITTSGKEDETSNTDELVVIKVGGKWYVDCFSISF